MRDERDCIGCYEMEAGHCGGFETCARCGGTFCGADLACAESGEAVCENCAAEESAHGEEDD